MSVSTVHNQYAYLDRDVNGGNPFQSLSVQTKSSDGSEPSETLDSSVGLFGKDGFGFDDFLDIINPLQHIPVVSTLYREFTGDQIEFGARIIGGGIFGGGIGLATSIVNAAIETETGQDIGGHIMDVVSSVTGIGDNGQVAEGEEVTITWNSARIETKDMAEAKPIQPVVSNSSDRVTDNTVLFQLAAQNQPANGLQLKAGFKPGMPQTQASPSIPVQTNAVIEYEKAAELQAHAPTRNVAATNNDYDYLDKLIDV